MPRLIKPAPTVSGARIDIQASAVAELVSAVITVAQRRDDRAWLVELSNNIGETAMQGIVTFCEPLRRGTDLIEFIADAPDHDNVDSFFEFVEGLSDREIAFYLLGRMYPPDTLPDDLSEQSVIALLEETDTADSAYHDGAGFAWANDVPATRQRIVEIFRLVWNGYLLDHLEEMRGRWREKIAEIWRYADRHGAEDLWQLLSDCDTLPMEIPPGRPYERILFIPSCLTSHGGCMFGYGTVIVTVSCDRSLEDAERRRYEADQMLSVLKALSDQNRLKLLRFIHKEERELNGKQMAELLGLSPSVVSRHLAQLRGAGLIEEHTTDNRNLTYSLNKDRIEGLSEAVLSYLKRPKHA